MSYIVVYNIVNTLNQKQKKDCIMKETIIISIIKSIWDLFLKKELVNLISNPDSEVDDIVVEILDKVISG